MMMIVIHTFGLVGFLVLGLINIRQMIIEGIGTYYIIQYFITWIMVIFVLAANLYIKLGGKM